MRGRLRVLCLALPLLVALGTACAAAGGGGGTGGWTGATLGPPAGPREPARREPRISVDVKDGRLDDVLRLIFKDTDQSVVVQSGIVVGAPVNLSLKNVPLEDAVKALTQVNGLDYGRIGKVWVVSQKEGVMTVGGVNVPVVGALAGGAEQAALLAEIGRRVGGGAGAGTGAPGKPSRIDFLGSRALVDLDVKDVPLSEVAVQLSKSVNARLAKEAEAPERQGRTSGPGRPRVLVVRSATVDIIAHESLKNVRVTARVYRWPAGEVLGMLIEQAGLVYTTEVEEPRDPPTGVPEGGVVTQRILYRVYLVPKPILEVEGPGARGAEGVVLRESRRED